MERRRGPLVLELHTGPGHVQITMVLIGVQAFGLLFLTSLVLGKSLKSNYYKEKVGLIGSRG